MTPIHLQENPPLKTISAVPRKATLRSKLVVAAIVIAVCVGLVWFSMRSALTPAERQIVGSWIIAKPPNQTTHVYTFTADRQFFGSTVDSFGVTIGEDPPAPGERWSVQDNTLLIHRSKGGPFGLYDFLPWIHADLHWHIDSLTDDTLTVNGGPGTKQLVWKRSPTAPGRMR